MQIDIHKQIQIALREKKKRTSYGYYHQLRVGAEYYLVCPDTGKYWTGNVLSAKPWKFKPKEIDAVEVMTQYALTHPQSSGLVKMVFKADLDPTEYKWAIRHTPIQERLKAMSYFKKRNITDCEIFAKFAPADGLTLGWHVKAAGVHRPGSWNSKTGWIAAKNLKELTHIALTGAIHQEGPFKFDEYLSLLERYPLPEKY